MLEDPRSKGKVVIRSAREKEAMRFKRWSTGLVGRRYEGVMYPLMPSQISLSNGTLIES